MLKLELLPKLSYLWQEEELTIPLRCGQRSEKQVQEKLKEDFLETDVSASFARNGLASSMQELDSVDPPGLLPVSRCF